MYILKNRNKRRLKFLFFILLVCIAVIIGRLIQIQFFHAPYLVEKAKKDRTLSRLHIHRGEILDRNNVKLATDLTVYDVYAHPNYYYGTTPSEIADAISDILNIRKDKLITVLSQQNLSTITLARKISLEQALQLKNLKMQCIDVVQTTERKYPQGLLASHILGFVNFELQGVSGVEHAANKNLKSVSKYPKVEVDGQGNILYNSVEDIDFLSSPIIGKTVKLTIDATLQYICEQALAKKVIESKAKRGAVIMLNPKNGELYAFAVYPSYNPNELAKIKNWNMIKNWAITDVYPPGSTFKVITIASAMEKKYVDMDTQINDTGKMQVQGFTITNYDYGKHGAPGSIDLYYLFEHSSNVGSAKIALSMSKENFREMIERFGFGRKTGLGLEGESSGILPLIDKYWDDSRQATMGFGYSIAATPIQMAAAISAIANKGIYLSPHLIKYPSQEEFNKKVVQRQVLSEATATNITHLLKTSIAKSAAQVGKIDGYAVAGKTGTSRKPNPNGKGYLVGSVYTSFVGYLPADNPELLIMVVVDDPRGSEVWGSTIAGPVFNAIAKEAVEYLNIQKDPSIVYSKKIGA